MAVEEQCWGSHRQLACSRVEAVYLRNGRESCRGQSGQGGRCPEFFSASHCRPDNTGPNLVSYGYAMMVPCEYPFGDAAVVLVNMFIVSVESAQ